MTFLQVYYSFPIKINKNKKAFPSISSLNYWLYQYNYDLKTTLKLSPRLEWKKKKKGINVLKKWTETQINNLEVSHKRSFTRLIKSIYVAYLIQKNLTLTIISHQFSTSHVKIGNIINGNHEQYLPTWQNNDNTS